MKIIALLFLLTPLTSIAQTKEVCSNYNTYKGKKNHGQKYCTSWISLGPKGDTVAWSYGGGRQFSNGSEKLWEGLSERNKYIYDSLSEDGFINYESTNMLEYEPYYMKEKVKFVTMFSMRCEKIVLMKYKLYNNDKGIGCILVGETEVK